MATSSLPDGPLAPASDLAAPIPPRRSPSIPGAFLLSLLAFVAPARAAARWRYLSLWRAWIIGAANIALLPLWTLLFLTLWQAADLRAFRQRALPTAPWVDDIPGTFTRQLTQTIQSLKLLLVPDPWTTFVSVISTVFLLTLVLAMTFFVLLPFAARQGPNRACVRHVLRATLMGTGFLHLIMFWLSMASLLLVLISVPAGPEHWAPWIFSAFCLGVLWSVAAMIRGVRVEYRTPADLPSDKNPQCDQCGYDLHLADPAGRCPECGKPVAESLDPARRPPTPWERAPRLADLALVLAQVRDLIVRPRWLFARMPTRTGQSAAQRWLIASIVFVAFIAFWTVPVIGLVLKRSFGFEWSAEMGTMFFVGGLTLAIVWALLGLMMVGIETAGVAAVGYFRGQSVPLASAAKVTCYASTLMFLWAILGSLQIIVGVLAWQYQIFKPYPPRVEEVATVVTLAVAHIGGLLWFEWTVYRGLRAIQYANH